MGHFYLPGDGTPFYKVPDKKNGGMRDADLRDARKVGALPSVTTIIGIMDKPGLSRWLTRQYIRAAFEWATRHINTRKVSVTALPISVRAQNALARSGIKTLGQLQDKTEIDLLKLPDFGKKSLYEVRHFLSQPRSRLIGSRSYIAALRALASFIKRGEVPPDVIAEIEFIANTVSRESKAEGEAIHDAIEAHFNGQPVPPKYQEPVRKVAALLEEKCGPQQWEAEVWFASRDGYGGKIDLVSDEWVIDFKTKDDHKIYGDMKDGYIMQLVAYDAGYIGSSDGLPRKIANVTVSRKDGSAVWWPWEDKTELIRAENMFELCLRLWKEKKRYLV